jgi:exonuclease III
MMKVCTWNVRRNKRAWQWIEKTLKPDIALVQESTPPPSLISDSHFVWKPIGGSRNWGTGVYVRDLPVSEVSLTTFQGWVTVAEVKLNKNVPLIVISLHAQIIDGYSITTLHHILSDLTHLIDGASNVLLGGDFNAGLLWDKKQKSPTHKIMFDRVEAFGLLNCHRLFHNKEQRTFRGRGGEPWQLDHLFMSKHLTKTIRSCDIVENEEVISLSDHNPIVMSFEPHSQQRANQRLPAIRTAGFRKQRSTSWLTD